MRIRLAKSAGFCFGVKRALAIAMHTAKTKKKVYMLGDIVHNEDVVRKINTSGIKKIKKLSKGRGKTLLIRAHGASLKIMNKARKLGYEIIDATCIMVKEIHKIVKAMEKKGYRLIVIGDKQHEEVQGIIGQIKSKAIVIDKIKHIPVKRISGLKKACVVVQSTQNIEKVNQILCLLKKHIKDLRFFNTICRPTTIKQEEIRKLPLENEVMIIIGSRNSANTKRLYEISKNINKNTYWVNSAKEINPSWFKGIETVGVTAGASTPDSTTRSITDFISRI